MNQTPDRPGTSFPARIAWWLDQPRVAVPFLLVLALLLRLHNLDESLWFDEVVYSTHYRSPSPDRFWALLLRIPGPPLYQLVSYFWVALVGDHEVIVRMPSMVCGLGSVALTYLIARRFASGVAALLAGVFLCFSPVHIWYSQEATPYAMTMFFLLAAVYIWPRMTMPRFSWTWSAAYLGALLAAVFTHYYAAVFLLPFTLLGAMAEKRARLRIFIANATVVLAVAALLAVRFMGGWLPPSPGFLRSFAVVDWWMLFFHWFLHGNSLWTFGPGRLSAGSIPRAPGLFEFQLAFAILVIWGLWPGRTAASRRLAGELALYLLALPLIIYVLSIGGYRRLYIERYLLLGLPFFAIALARGASRVSHAGIRTALCTAVVVVSIASYEGFLAKDSRWTVYKPNPDWRSAASFMRTQVGPSDRVIFLTIAPLDDFSFYLRKAWPGRPRIERYRGEGSEREWVDAKATQIVIVRNRFWREGIDEAIASFRSSPLVRLTTTRSFKSVDLYTFVPTGTGPAQVIAGSTGTR